MFDKIAERVFEEAKHGGYAVAIALAVIVAVALIFNFVVGLFT